MDIYRNLAKKIKAPKTVLSGLLVISLFVIIFGGTIGCTTRTKSNPSAIQAIPVKVKPAEISDIETITQISGKVLPISKADIVSKSAGRVEKVNISVGAIVKQGDILLTLESTEIQAQVLQAQSALEMAKARLVQYTDSPSGENAAIRQAELSLELARTHYERMVNLFSQGAVPKSQVEAAQTQLAAAEYGYETTKQQYEIAKAGIKQSQAALDLAKTALSNTIITSPIDGTITALNINLGEMAAPGIPLISVADSSKVKVEINASESIINQIEPGSTLEVYIEAVSSSAFSGKIETVSPAADPRTMTYPVVLVLDNRENALKPGMFARVDVPSQRRENVVVVPKESLKKSGDYYVVYVVVEPDRVKEIRVKVGLSNSDYVEIEDGINPGDKVVIMGQESLSNASPIVVVE